MAKLVSSSARPTTKRIISDDSSSEDETPIAKRSKSEPDKPAPAPLTSTDSESEDEQPILKSKPNRPPPPPPSSDLTSDTNPSTEQEDDDHDGDRPIASKQNRISSNRSLDGESSATTTLTNTSEAYTPNPKRPLSKTRKSTNGNTLIKQEQKSPSPPSSSSSSSSSSDEDDQPLVKKSAPKNKPRASATKKTPVKKIKKDPDSDDSEEDRKPLINKPAKKIRLSNSQSATPKPTAKSKKKASAKAIKKHEEDEKPAGSEDEEDEQFKWWEQTKDDDTKKWSTLQHNGVLFPPSYVPLPKYVKMKYDGKPVDLPPESEEVAGFFGAMLNSDHCQKPTFCQNFFRDFCNILKSHPPRDGTRITQFEKCDFTPIFEYYDAERERKKTLSKDEKLRLKKEKEALEERYKFCLLDGRQEKVGNFRVEPPSLFRGRGEHPKTGMLKKRVHAEDITINCGADSKFPEPPEGHQWGEIVHLDKASWLAMWKENINGAFKYVFLAPGSSLKGQSDMKKFEKARLLKSHIERIRADYREQLSDKVMATRQRATAMYLIDRLALRAGNEKGDDEADTVGCCSLRYEHLTLEPPNTVTFDFLGKDSIRFFNTVQVDAAVFKNLQIFKKAPKAVGDMIFDRLTTTTLNKHLSDYMPGLTAKVFRTYNASWTFERELEKNMDQLKNPTPADKIYAYNKANREVAVLCNHQKSVSKTHESSMEKLYDKIRAMKYQRRRLRYKLLESKELDKKTRKKYEQDESDLDDEWMDKHEEELETKGIERIQKKFEKDCQAAEKEGKKPLKPSELAERLEEMKGYAKSLRKERKNKRIESGMNRSEEQLIGSIEKMDVRIKSGKVSCKDRDEGKETSLGTSKLNYIDPRLTYAWCAKYDVPVEKMFAKTLREKFTWAAATPADWKF